MKKNLVILIGCLFIFPSVAFAGSYDGVWTSPAFDGIYFMIRNETNSIIFIEIDSDFSGCDVLCGSLSGNIANIRMFEQADEDHILEVQITFTSNTTASGHFVSCSGDCEEYPIGEFWELSKIY